MEQMYIRKDILKEHFEELIKEYKLPGIAVLIRGSDGSCLFDTSGYADIAKQIKIDLDTCFPIASLTKLFAVVIILRLHEQKYLSIYNSLSDYGIQNCKMNNITIEDLLMHTSDKSYNDFKYSDRRFYFLEKVIINATGKTFYQHLQEMIIQPLQLTGTLPCTMLNNTSIYHRLVRTYHFVKTKFTEVTQDINAFFGVNSGLVSNLKDMSVFLENINSGNLLSEKMKTIMFSNKHSITESMYRIGHGVFVANIENCRVGWNFGCNSGVSIITMMMQDNKSYAILAANSNVMCCDFSLERGEFYNSPFCRQLFDVMRST